MLFAGQDAPSYAPELKVRGVAVAAPAADLGTLLDDDIPDASGVTLGSYAFAAYQSVYAATIPGLSLDQILTPEGVAATPGMAELCLLGQHDELQAQADALVGHYLRSDPAVTEPWSTLLAQNTPGPAALTMPLYVAQGDADTLVLPAATKQFVGAAMRGRRSRHLRAVPRRHPRFDRADGDAGGAVVLHGACCRSAPPASTC